MKSDKMNHSIPIDNKMEGTMEKMILATILRRINGTQR